MDPLELIADLKRQLGELRAGDDAGLLAFTNRATMITKLDFVHFGCRFAALCNAVH